MRRLQCGGIFAVDCVVEASTIWVGILSLDPAKVEEGGVYLLHDLDGGDRYPIRLNIDHTPAYRHRLERVDATAIQEPEQATDPHHHRSDQR